MDLYLCFEHAESSNSDSYVHSWVRISIALRCQSRSDTFYIVSEIENQVKLIEHIHTLHTWGYTTFSSGVWLRLMLHICLACLICTIVPVNCWETFSRNNLLFLDVTWQIIKSLEQSSSALCLYPSSAVFFSLQMFLPLRASDFWCHFKNWIHFIYYFFLLLPLNHLITFFICSLFHFSWIYFYPAAKFLNFSIKLM